MKNYILTLLFALVTLTGCTTEEYYYKTPGEVTGEKITELLESGNYMSQCQIANYYTVSVPFSIEGQFLHIETGYNTMTFDLNQLTVWTYVKSNNAKNSYFSFNFKMN